MTTTSLLLYVFQLATLFGMCLTIAGLLCGGDE